MNDRNRKQAWLEIRTKAAKTIDPEATKIEWSFGQVLDPYGVDPDLPEECDCIGRQYFACAPGSAIWLWIGDCPEPTRKRLWQRIDNGELEEMDVVF